MLSLIWATAQLSTQCGIHYQILDAEGSTIRMRKILIVISSPIPNADLRTLANLCT